MDPGTRFVNSVVELFTQRPELDEVFFNGPDVAAFASGHGAGLMSSGVLPPLNSFFPSTLAVMDWLQDLAASCSTRLDPMAPSAGGKIPGHSARWHAMFPPLVRNGPVLCIRKSRLGSLTLGDFHMEVNVRDALRVHLLGGGSLLVSGPTGSGKSSFIAAVLREFLSGRRMVIIESVEELTGLSDGHVDLVARPPNLIGAGEIGVGWLFQESLRLRPDGIVIGEIRGQEASAFCGALVSGHRWCLATIHAGSPREALARLSILAGDDSARVVAEANLALVQLSRDRPENEGDRNPRDFGARVVGYQSLSGLQ